MSLPRTMIAGVFKSKGRVALERVALPVPAADEVLVRIRACGICGSDLHRIFHETAVPGVVLGHEWVGEVASVGQDVHELKIGQRVVPGNGPGWPGGAVPASPNDPPAATGSEIAGARARHSPRDNGRRCFPGTNQQGGFAEYTLRKRWCLGVVPDDLTDLQAAACEPIAVAVHGVRQAEVKIGDTVAVIGLGPIGLFVVQCARLQGATKIIAVDPDAHRRTVAASFGPEVVTVDPKAGDALDAVVGLAGGSGPGIAIECAGAADTLQLALECVAFHGRVALVAVRWTATPIVSVEWLGRQPTLITCYAYGPVGWSSAMDLQRLGRLTIERMVVPEHIYPLSRLPEALEIAAAQRAGVIKPMIVPDSAATGHATGAVRR